MCKLKVQVLSLFTMTCTSKVVTTGFKSLVCEILLHDEQGEGVRIRDGRLVHWLQILPDTVCF